MSTPDGHEKSLPFPHCNTPSCIDSTSEPPEIALGTIDAPDSAAAIALALSAAKASSGETKKPVPQLHYPLKKRLIYILTCSLLI